jgi:hypothetical protein
MNEDQEETLYEFLENASSFSLDEVDEYMRAHGSPRGSRHLRRELRNTLELRGIAFLNGDEQWVTRRGCFEGARFAIKPTREELLNGVLIPGHRCVPFANPRLMPHEYVFSYEGQPVPVTSSEGEPGDFYPYYGIFGEEYVPQYVARDNPANQEAFEEQFFDDPLEISIHVLDMRNIYRSSGFVPGDRFDVIVSDWKTGSFILEHAPQDRWAEADLEAWSDAAQQGFAQSFKLLGPGVSTEEQVAFAFWYGGERMRSTPAYALEEFLYTRTDRVELVGYGIESRFWHAGKEIPDSREVSNSQTLPDRTLVENLLFHKYVPISEYVVMAYVRDALFMGESDPAQVLTRIVPPAAGAFSSGEQAFLEGYIAEVFNEYQAEYNRFTDSHMGPVRRRIAELHTAAIDLAARLRKGDIEESSLPKHTFIILAQIQDHAATLLEDLNAVEEGPEIDFEMVDTSVDNLIETYEDIRAQIDESLDTFRQRTFSVVRNIDGDGGAGRIVQISIAGTDIWRRLEMAGSYSLAEVHSIIQAMFAWKGLYPFRFLSCNESLHPTCVLTDLDGASDVSYEYGDQWIVKLLIISGSGLEHGVRCIAGACSPPPETIDGPIQFRRYLEILENGTFREQHKVRSELGGDFNAALFTIDACNTILKEF